MTCCSNGLTQETSALKAGFYTRSGLDLEKKGCTKVSEKGPRPWRTRTTALAAIFPSEIEPLLIADPSLISTMILDHIQGAFQQASAPKEFFFASQSNPLSGALAC